MVLNVEEMNLSFGGCGYLGIYHLGVASCFRQYAPHVFQNKIAGASVGALIASAFLCDVPIETCASKVMEVTLKTRSGLLGALKPENGIMEMLYRNMWAMLPDDAHLHCSGKLHVSVTRKRDQKNVLLSQFNSKKDVVEALMCSCYIPFYCGSVFPKFHGEEYMDGGCSNNMPKLDENTIRILALYGQCDIHPPKNGYVLKTVSFSNTVIYFTLENMIRFIRILCPGSANMLQDLCQQGYNDALTYLRNHGIVSCPNCKNLSGSINRERYLDHSTCDSMLEPLSPKITGEFTAAIKQLEGSYLDWLLEYQLFKLLYFLNTPSIAIGQWSFFFIKVICRRLKHKASSCAGSLLNDVLSLLKYLMRTTGYSSQFSCKISAIENGTCAGNHFHSEANGTPCMIKTSPPNESQSSVDVQVAEKSVENFPWVTPNHFSCKNSEREIDEDKTTTKMSSVIKESMINISVKKEADILGPLQNGQILQINNMLDVSGKYSAVDNLNINIPTIDREAVLS